MPRPCLILLAAAITCTCHAAPAGDACAATSTPISVPLVELYTSEGCSSCPPADNWLSRNASDGTANFLAFHVDYWDGTGWADRFASHAYTVRQQRRVRASGGRTIYTPQVMVGTHVQANWRDVRAFQALLRDARHPATVALAIHLQHVGTGWQVVVDAIPQAHATPSGSLWLARYVDGQTTQVKAGENGGRTLQHDRVVRELHGPWLLGQMPVSRRITLPVQRGPWGLTAFVQDAAGNVGQSLGLASAGCR